MHYNYSSFYKRILENPGKFFMDVKREHKLCIKIYKTLNTLVLWKKSLKCSRLVRQQYKLSLNISRKNQVACGTKNLKSLGPNIWNNMRYHIKSTKNLNVLKGLLKNGTVPPVSYHVFALWYFSTILLHRSSLCYYCKLLSKAKASSCLLILQSF